MKVASFVIMGYFVVSATAIYASGRRFDVIVDWRGTGDFRTIQSALNSVPAGRSERTTILIRNGLYNEKIFITRSHLVLAGESRDSTRIVYPELREQWNREHDGSDWGAGVVNIDSETSDVTLANLTVYNNYGSLYGAYNKHQFAIRGYGTRVILLRCAVISDGGDALSLWDKQDGMYYHENCLFEGWVDFVCPRGWCFISDSRFFGHNTASASIWHDGSTDKNQKFVIVNSFFDGVSGFPLGRNHLDAQFFLIGCRFSSNMSDRPFFRPPSSPKPWAWGDRHYFYGCHREGGDYAWFRDNIGTAEGSPRAEEITPVWAFDGRWNPESDLPEVLPMTYHPAPMNRAEHVSADSLRLTWRSGRDASAHDVYFGASDSMEFRQRTPTGEFFPGSLAPATTYRWRVDEVTDEGIVKGDVWEFTTAGKQL